VFVPQWLRSDSEIRHPAYAALSNDQKGRHMSHSLAYCHC
jgi:hypothetical protein